MRVATIDIGTNSVLLLVADIDAARPRDAVVIEERATITRLGQGVDRTHALAAEAVERTLACLATYGEAIRGAGAERVDVVGTSAMRDAHGGDVFVGRAQELLGAAPRVISGAEEAALTYEGALVGIDIGASAAVAVFDIGGGSTEIIFGAPGGGVAEATSLDIGSVRLTERHVRSDPPTAAEVAHVREDARAQLAKVERLGATEGAITTWVGVAGTVTTIAALVHDVAPYDGARVHGARVRASALDRTLTTLSAMPLADRRRLPALDAARADVIVAGCVIAQEVLSAARADELVASDRGVRWGLALRLARSARG